MTHKPPNRHDSGFSPLSTSVCVSCFVQLKRVEREHYETRCERCELAWLRRLSRYREGARDNELDALFGGSVSAPPGAGSRGNDQR